jgi:hypothetical protein
MKRIILTIANTHFLGIEFQSHFGQPLPLICPENFYHLKLNFFNELNKLQAFKS